MGGRKAGNVENKIHTTVNTQLNSQGQKRENKDEILIKEYARYCKELLKIRPADQGRYMKEEEIEQIPKEISQEIIQKENRLGNNSNNVNKNKESNEGNEKKSRGKNNWKA